MKLLLVGYGKMGQLVAQLAHEFDGEVAGIVDPVSPAAFIAPSLVRIPSVGFASARGRRYYDEP